MSNWTRCLKSTIKSYTKAAVAIYERQARVYRIIEWQSWRDDPKPFQPEWFLTDDDDRRVYLPHPRQQYAKLYRNSVKRGVREGILTKEDRTAILAKLDAAYALATKLYPRKKRRRR